MADLKLRKDFDASVLRRAALKSVDAGQARRLPAMVANDEGVNRTDAARLAGMDRQIPRDWLERFKEG